MLNRISVNAILKSVIAVLAAVVVVVLAQSAWTSWTRLKAVDRIVSVADASAHLFTALHNLRSDRSRSYRFLIADEQLAPKDFRLWESRDAEMPALKSALATLESADFSGHDVMAAGLAQRIKKLTALHEESAAAVMQPKASRRPGLAPEIRDEITAFIEMLDKLSLQLDEVIKLEDPYIDQMMELKQLAWLARDAGGEASVILSNSLSGQPLPTETMLKYVGHVGKLSAVWALLEQRASGLRMPARFTDAVARANREQFAPDFTDLRTRILKKLIAGEPAEMNADQWSTLTVARLSTLLRTAEAALDSAKEHAAVQRVSALRMLSLELLLLALAVAFAAGMFVLVSRRVTGPLHRIQEAMMKLAAGDFGVVVPGLGRKDEIGAMANAVERFKVVADEKARNEADEVMRRQQSEAAIQAKAAEERAKVAEEQAQAFRALSIGLGKLSNGDLTFRLSDGFTADYGQIRDEFNNTIARLQETIQAIAASTQEVAGTATEISGSTTDLSQRTEEQAASLEETSASMEEISTTVKKNAENAQQANAFANSTRAVADRGGAVVAEAVSAMSRIEESSRKISDIISVIDEIARQTNLLALNAAVEAARAGEAGRGFAVVASEVRSLAQRSSQAAKDIKDLITNSSGQVQEGVELVNKAGGSLTEIVESIKKVAEIVSDIAAASIEQASGIDQVKAALSQMDEVTQQNSALVEENAAAAKALEQQSQSMDERVSVFRLGDVPAVAAASQLPAPVRRTAVEPTRAHAATASKHAQATTPRRGGPVGRMQAALATAINDDPDWKEF
jgi:methyl-accepting chemotaxis protein